MFPSEVTASMLKRIVHLHERRFQNLYTKQKPSYMTLSLEGCRRFLETGKSRDQFLGIRPFSPEERLQNIFRQVGRGQVRFETILRAFSLPAELFEPLRLGKRGRVLGIVHCVQKLLLLVMGEI